jgi:protein CpxP
MNKRKIISGLTIALIAINIIALGFFFFGHKPPREGKKHSPKLIIVKKLDLDKSQVAAYEKLITIHRSSINKLDRKLMEAKNNLYQDFNRDGAASDSLLRNISAIQVQIEKAHFVHFQELKKICKPSQEANFDELSQELAHLFAPNGDRKKRK